jgi:hypothetical protein
MTKTLPRYYDNNKSYLELHANHTVWKLDNEHTDDDLYCWTVEAAVERFEDETGVPLFMLGRSGRHICVEDTAENSRKYQYLRNKALKLEKEVVDTFNNYNPDDDE